MLVRLSREARRVVVVGKGGLGGLGGQGALLEGRSQGSDLVLSRLLLKVVSAQP